MTFERPPDNQGAKEHLSKTEHGRAADSAFRIPKGERAEMDDLMRTEAAQRLPTLEHELSRALLDHDEVSYEHDGVIVERGNLPLWHFMDLADSIEFIYQWKAYIPSETYRSCITALQSHAGDIKRVMDEYRNGWAPSHESILATQEKLITFIVNLRGTVPNLLEGELISVTDDEFRRIGSGGLGFRDLENHRRILLAQSTLAQFDPERFARFFSSQWSETAMAEAQRYWESWDEQHPKDLPKCIPALENIRHALRGDYHS